MWVQAVFESFQFAIEQATDVVFLHHIMAPCLLAIPLVGFLWLVVAVVTRQSARVAWVQIACLLPLVFGYDVLLDKVVEPNFSPEERELDLLDPYRTSYREKLAEHQQELQLLYIPAGLVFVAAFFGALTQKCGIFKFSFFALIYIPVLVFLLLLLQRKVRITQTDLPLSPAQLEQFFQSSSTAL